MQYNLAHEEDTRVTGDAHLNIPADAGLRLAARAGIGLGITGASATGGPELGGALGLGLAAREMGADLALGVRFPVRYREGEPFAVSADDLVFEVPDIDTAALLSQLGRELF